MKDTQNHTTCSMASKDHWIGNLHKNNKFQHPKPWNVIFVGSMNWPIFAHPSMEKDRVKISIKFWTIETISDHLIIKT